MCLCRSVTCHYPSLNSPVYRGTVQRLPVVASWTFLFSTHCGAWLLGSPGLGCCHLGFPVRRLNFLVKQGDSCRKWRWVAFSTTTPRLCNLRYITPVCGCSKLYDILETSNVCVACLMPITFQTSECRDGALCWGGQPHTPCVHSGGWDCGEGRNSCGELIPLRGSAKNKLELVVMLC